MPEATKLEIIKKKITKSQVWNSSHVQSVTAFLAGDHWQKNAGWLGPRPKVTDETATLVNDVLAEIERTFISQNLIAECVSRHVNAVSVEPNITMTITRELGVGADGQPEQPSDDENKRIRLVNAAITNWMDSRKLNDNIIKAVTNAIATGRGVLRLYIPNSSSQVGLDGQPFIPQGELKNVMARIGITSPSPTSAGVLLDMNDDPQAAYLSFLEIDETKLTETKRLEIQTLEGKNTIVEVETQTGFNTARYPLEGVFLTYEINCTALVTPQIVSLQKLVNKTLTMMSKNVDVAGFIESTILNGELPFVEIDDLANPGQKIRKIVGMKSGPAIKNFIAPAQVQLPDGTWTTTPASQHDRLPVQVTTFVDTLYQAETSLYKEFKQLHVLMGNDAGASGRSRIQALNDFRSSVRVTVKALEAAYRWLFAVLVKLAAYFEGNATAYDDLRPMVSITPEIMFVDADEIRVLIEMHEKGLLSRESAMLASQRVTDPQAEREALKREAFEDRGIGDPNKLRDSLANAVANNMMSIEASLLELGYTKEQVPVIVAQIMTESASLQSGVPAQQPGQ
jgi:hypothetical protein